MKGFKAPGNMQGLLKQAQKMQEDLAKAQEEARTIIVESSAGGGVIKVTATGEGRLESILISRDAVDPNDTEMLQDLVLAAVNDALGKASEATREAMRKVTGGMDIPGL